MAIRLNNRPLELFPEDDEDLGLGIVDIFCWMVLALAIGVIMGYCWHYIQTGGPS